MMSNALIFVALTAGVPGQAPSPGELLIGTWYMTRREASGTVNATVTFDRTGRISNRIVSPNGIRMRIGFYKLNGNRLSATLEENRKISDHASIIKEVSQNTLIIEDEDGTVVFRRRSGPR